MEHNNDIRDISIGNTKNNLYFRLTVYALTARFAGSLIFDLYNWNKVVVV